jgi:hypothetical protein
MVLPLKFKFFLVFFVFVDSARAEQATHQSPALTPNTQSEALADSVPPSSIVIKLRDKIAELELKQRTLTDLQGALEQGLKKDPKSATVTAQLSGASALSMILLTRKKPKTPPGRPVAYVFDGSLNPTIDTVTPLELEDYDEWKRSFQSFLNNNPNRPASLTMSIDGKRVTFEIPSQLEEFIKARSGGRMNSIDRQVYRIEELYLNSMAADYKAGQLETSAAQALKSRQEQRRLDEVAEKLRKRRVKGLVGASAAASVAIIGMMWVNSDNTVTLSSDRAQAEQTQSNLTQVQLDLKQARDELEEELFESLKSSAKPVVNPSQKPE